MNELLQIIGLSALAQSLTWATPFRLFLSVFGLDGIDPKASAPRRYLQELFSCCLCLGAQIGFWSYLITGHGLFNSLGMAGAVLFGARLVDAAYDVLPCRIKV